MPERQLTVTEAAGQLRTSARMLRYRERLGLLPRATQPGRHRRYGEDQLRAAAAAIDLEQRYDVSPAALAFALRAVADPRLAADVRRLGLLTGAVRPPELAALTFEQEKALRLLGRAGRGRPGGQ